MSRTIHFVFSVPRPSNVVWRAINKLIAKTNIVPLLYRGGSDFFIPWRKPVRAPHSISYNLLQEFKKHGKVKFYGMYENTVCDLKEDDILIGVPSQDHSTVPWVKPDYNTVFIKTLQKYPDHKHLYMLIPYSNEPQYLRWADEIIEKYGKNLNLALLGGKIWFDNWDQSLWKDYPIKSKIRLDMGIDASSYPVIKKKFNPNGKRGFFYVGSALWYKNIPQLEKIAAQMPDYAFGYVGGGPIKGWEQIACFVDLDEAFMAKMSEKYDFFVNVSRDAQVTTVLEQMCFGMVVACTPESGYLCPSLIPLSTDDTSYNVDILKKLQNMDEDDLLEIAKKNREYVISHHSWKQFTDAVVSYVGLTS